MPADSIALLLQSFKSSAEAGLQEIEQFSHESPLERMRKEIQEQLEKSEKYRASILQKVNTFAGLSLEAILSAARSMEEVFFKRGDIIIQQDEIGDSFYVLEEGLVSVTRKANMKDPNEEPRELAQLGKNSHFGEIALLTAEPRSATIIVISTDAKCLRMTKQKFEELVTTTNQMQAEHRKTIGRDVLEEVPLFKSLTNVNKKKLLDAMIPIPYLPQTYICRQGSAGNTFYILTEGTCRVTVNERDGSEKEVARLQPGDFFGEVALIESSNRRTANVISSENVSCLTLNRNDFNRLLKSLKVKIMEQQASRSGGGHHGDHGENEVRQLNMLSKKRRISGYNTHGQRDEIRIANLLKRFCRFATESLWNSLYSRMYREMLLDNAKVAEYGKYATFIMRSNDTRAEAVKAINDQAIRILETDPARRTPADHSFIFGLMKQRNFMKDRLCRNWPLHQFITLCKRMRLMRISPFRKIIEVDSRGTTVFMILRGCVRIFGRLPGTGVSSKVFFEEDLCPGEIFGEAALSGMHTRLITALSMTHVDLVYIDDQDYMSAQDRDAMQMGTEERSKFLAQVPMFRNWDSYKLLRLAHALVQEEVDKGTVLIKDGAVSKDIHFIVSGRVDIVDSLEKRNIITSLLKHDYFGESGFVNKYQKKSQAHTKHTEEFYATAVTKLDILILQEANYHLFDMSSIAPLRSAFLAKIEWRRERVQRMKVERAIMRKQYYKMHDEAEHLPIWTMNGQQVGGGGGGGGGGGMATTSIDSFSYDKFAEMDDGKSQVSGPQFQVVATSPLPSRPSSPVLLLGEKPVKEYPMSPLDKAYQTALVHPLDERLGDIKFWTERNPAFDEHHQYHAIEKKSKLDNIEDIPVLLAKDFDLLMVSSSCNIRQFEKTQEFLSQGKRPLSGKNGVNFHNALSYKLSASRPQSPMRSVSGDWTNNNNQTVHGNNNTDMMLPALTPISRPSTSNSKKLFNTQGMGINASFDAFHNKSDGMLIQTFHPHLQTQIHPPLGAAVRPATSGGFGSSNGGGGGGGIASLYDYQTLDQHAEKARSKSTGNVRMLLQEEFHPKGTLMKGITHLSAHPLISIKKTPASAGGSGAKTAKLALSSASPKSTLMSGNTSRQYGNVPSPGSSHGTRRR